MMEALMTPDIIKEDVKEAVKEIKPMLPKKQEASNDGVPETVEDAKIMAQKLQSDMEEK